MYRVRFYEEKSGKRPIQEFINSTQKSLRGKINRQIMHLEEFGLTYMNPYLKKISGTPLWEVRILGRDSVRIICVAIVKKEVLVMHIFKKKTNKTSPKDLKISIERYKKLDK